MKAQTRRASLNLFFSPWKKRMFAKNNERKRRSVCLSISVCMSICMHVCLFLSICVAICLWMKKVEFCTFLNLTWVLFNNYVTLKLPFFDPPSPHYHASSRVIAGTPLMLRHAWHRYPLLSFDSVFWSWNKIRSYTSTHGTSTIFLSN